MQFKKEKYFLTAVIFSLFLFFGIQKALAGTAELTWTAPTTNSDGSALSDLGGYKVYYGTTARTCVHPDAGNCGYSNEIDVHNVITYTLNDLTDGQTYYFSVTAYDTSGNESDFSNEASKIMTVAQAYGIADFANLAADWLQTKTSTADVSGDGTVNSKDMGIMMSHWAN